jgi:4-carboxymuconolactone decarboxylase
LTADDIDAIRLGELPGEEDQAVVQAVDELIDAADISADVWTELGRHFTDEQRMDLVFTIGGYCLLAMAVNTFGIEDETV